MIYHPVIFPLHRNKPVTIKSGFLPKVNQNAPYLGGLEWFYFFPISRLSSSQINMTYILGLYQMPKGKKCVCVCVCAAGE